jgi:hypothetical protein
MFPKGNQNLKGQIIMEWSFVLLFSIFNAVIFVQLLFLPILVIIDSDLKELEIKYLLLGSKVVKVENIDSYSLTVITTKSDSYKGLLLYLTDGKKILLSDFNLKDYTSIESFLNESGIKNSGNEKFRFLAYYMQ